MRFLYKVSISKISKDKYGFHCTPANKDFPFGKYKDFYFEYWGQPNKFLSFLKRLKVSDSINPPRSIRTMTYEEIYNQIIEGLYPVVYIWSNLISKDRVHINELDNNLGIKEKHFLDSNKSAKDWLKEKVTIKEV